MDHRLDGPKRHLNFEEQVQIAAEEYADYLVSEDIYGNSHDMAKKPLDPARQRERRRNMKKPKMKDPNTVIEERLTGAPVNAVSRYYYWSNSVTLPDMKPIHQYFGQTEKRNRFSLEHVRQEDLEMRRSVPIKYDERANHYNSEYEFIGDAYAAYLDGSISSGKSSYGQLTSWSTHQVSDHFYFSEIVIEKIASQAVYDVDGILALAGEISKNPFTDVRGQAAEAKINQNGVIINLRVVLAYGVNGREVFREIRNNVSNQIKAMTDLDVDAVHIEVVDIMTREEFNTRYESQASDIQKQQLAK